MDYNVTAINHEWDKYYEVLESIRKSGKINMWGASLLLAKECQLDEDLARGILISWIYNYDKLCNFFQW